MDDDSEQLARFEEMGEETVRLHVQTFGFAITNHRLAIKWLAQKDQESERRREASNRASMGRPDHLREGL